VTRTPELGWHRAGSGEPLLLLHGIGTTRSDFDAVLPRLADRYDVLAIDLPGHGESPPMARRPTVEALAEAIEADLDAHGLGRVHILGNSLGARLALELARRGRALSVVALAPSGLSLPAERVHQGLLMGGTRLVTRMISPLIYPLSASPLGRTALLASLRARPWEASERDAQLMKDGFADAAGFWRMLWWSTLMDVPTGLAQVDCPVVLAQGTADVVACGQTPRYLLAVPGSRFRPLLWAGHAPHSDSPAEIVSLVRMATRLARTRRTAGRPGVAEAVPG
jgi:pimeloyl-ACP methyl ester carboxylesterase